MLGTKVALHAPALLLHWHGCFGYPQGHGGLPEVNEKLKIPIAKCG